MKITLEPANAHVRLESDDASTVIEFPADRALLDHVASVLLDYHVAQRLADGGTDRKEGNP